MEGPIHASYNISSRSSHYSHPLSPFHIYHLTSTEDLAEGAGNTEVKRPNLYAQDVLALSTVTQTDKPKGNERSHLGSAIGCCRTQERDLMTAKEASCLVQNEAGGRAKKKHTDRAAPCKGTEIGGKI